MGLKEGRKPLRLEERLAWRLPPVGRGLEVGGKIFL